MKAETLGWSLYGGGVGGGGLLRNERREEPLLQRLSLGGGLLGIGRTWEEFGRKGQGFHLSIAGCEGGSSWNFRSEALR